MYSKYTITLSRYKTTENKNEKNELTQNSNSTPCRLSNPDNYNWNRLINVSTHRV